ncbi:MAG: hypothetical protein EDX89_23780 [Acidobacteria bacterium]|nr:MAG: hypothetical protein EDX89_23780 [Acidobacteriota bacterium]
MAPVASPTLLARLLLAVAFAAAGVAAWAEHRADLARRAEGAAFAKRYSIDVRRPSFVETAKAEATGDLAYMPLVDAAVQDAMGTVALANLEPSARKAWIESAQELTAELAAARGLSLSGLAARPGWAYHAELLAFLTYTGDRRTAPVDLTAKSARWELPARMATRLSPGDDATWGFLAGAYLETWPRLPERTTAQALPILQRAFEDPDFVRRGFGAAVAYLGVEPAARLLPKTPDALRTARDIVGKRDVPAAARLHAIWETVERETREKDLARLEELAERGDVPGRRRTAEYWLVKHPPGEFDDENGRREVGRLVEAWPEGSHGPWPRDPRAQLVQHLLAGRLASVRGTALARLGNQLTGVPDSVRARLLLAAGDRYGWERILLESGGVGSFDWTRFFTELAARELAAGDAEKAEEALSRIARPARTECDVLLVRRAVAREAGKTAEEREAEAGLALAVEDRFGAERFAGGRTVSPCVDPERWADAALLVKVASPGVSLVGYGWDGGRIGTTLVSGEATLAVPLSGLSGRRSFSIATLAGPEARASEGWVTTSTGVRGDQPEAAQAAPLPPPPAP